MYRKAVVKDYFYPADEKELREFFNSIPLNIGNNKRSDCKCAIVPHAGYVYSGATAYKTLSMIDIPKNIILISPNHTGLGPSKSVFPGGFWETPFGDVAVNDKIAMEFVKFGFEADFMAHHREHSIEVILPILKYIKSDINIIPITLKKLSYSECVECSNMISRLIENNSDTIVVVSTDFNHFEDEDATFLKDSRAIERILSIDGYGLYEEVIKYDISMCGFIPTVISLEWLKRINGIKSELVEHTNSADRGGSKTNVVGYAGILFYV